MSFLPSLIKFEGNVTGEIEMQERIAELAAAIYARRDWHKLSLQEQELVTLLQKGGHLVQKDQPDGFVGRVPVPAIA